MCGIGVFTLFCWMLLIMKDEELVKPETSNPRAPGNGKDDRRKRGEPKPYNGVPIHIVFSTGCNDYQNWQAEALLYSWWKVRQPGKITRTISGCRDEEHLGHALRTAVDDDNVNFFITRDFSNEVTNTNFKWYNKPFSLAQWVNSTTFEDDEIIVILDPDMVITSRFEFPMRAMSGVMVNPSKGKPYAQKYGIGDKWITWGVCIHPNCKSIDSKAAWKYYSNGPPYMLNARDFQRLAPWWVYYTPVAYEHESDILADMYAYALASGHNELPHEPFISMVSDGSHPALKNFESWLELRYDFGGELEVGPYFLHYCQWIWIGDKLSRATVEDGGFAFHKGHIPRTILRTCDIPLLMEPPPFTIQSLSKDKSPFVGGQLWFLKQLVPRVNEAFANHRAKYCPDTVLEKKVVVYTGGNTHSKSQWGVIDRDKRWWLGWDGMLSKDLNIGDPHHIHSH